MSSHEKEIIHPLSNMKRENTIMRLVCYFLKCIYYYYYFFLQRIHQWRITSAPFRNLTKWRQTTSASGRMWISPIFKFFEALFTGISWGTMGWQIMSLMVLKRVRGEFDRRNSKRNRLVKWTLFFVWECVWDFVWRHKRKLIIFGIFSTLWNNAKKIVMRL